MKTETPQPPKTLILPALISIMREVGAIDKGRENTFHKFKFRGIDDVYNALHELFAKHGVVCAPIEIESKYEDTVFEKKITRSTVTKVTYRFQAEDGSYYDTQAIGEGVDAGDKSTSKSLAFAHKYLLLQMFLIPTEEGVQRDPDYDSPQLTRDEEAQRNVETAVANREENRGAQVTRWQDVVCHVGSVNGPFLNKRLDAIVRPDHLNGSRKLYDALVGKFIPANTARDKALKAALDAAGRELASWEAEAVKEATRGAQSVPEASQPETKPAEVAKPTDWRMTKVPWGTQAGKPLGDLEWIVIEALGKLIESKPAVKWDADEKRFVAHYALARSELHLDDNPKAAEKALLADLRSRIDNLALTESTVVTSLIERGLLLGPAESLEQYDLDAYRMLVIYWNILGPDMHREFAPKADPDKPRKGARKQ